jgi:hypothetical protein
MQNVHASQQFKKKELINELLREEVAQTLSDPAQAEEEMQSLFSALTE